MLNNQCPKYSVLFLGQPDFTSQSQKISTYCTSVCWHRDKILASVWCLIYSEGIKFCSYRQWLTSQLAKRSGSKAQQQCNREGDQKQSAEWKRHRLNWRDTGSVKKLVEGSGLASGFSRAPICAMAQVQFQPEAPFLHVFPHNWFPVLHKKSIKPKNNNLECSISMV